jgi:hypothetical protein
MRTSPVLLPAALAAVLGVLACAAPGVDIAPQPGDFAFLEVALQG